MVRRAEWGVAILVTALAVYLHFVFMQHAGGLWRDEAGLLNLATKDSWAGLWHFLHCDSFPIFWVLVVRCWAGIGLGGDAAVRLLGLLVGLSILAALWFNARCLKITIPFYSLLLFGLSPAVIIWEDSMRAYGWGVLWILLTFGLIWRVVESPTRVNTFCATVAALGSVHTLYYNPVLLFAFCVGGVSVTLRRRLWKRSMLLAGIGLIAAVSLLPYIGVIQRGADQSVISQEHYGLENFAVKIIQAVSRGGPVVVFLWALLVAAGLVTAGICQFRPAALKATPSQQDLLLFSLTALLTGAAGYFLFLRNLKFMTQVWYYAALLAVAAVALDAMLSVLANSEKGRRLRLAFVSAAVLVTFPAVWDAVQLRMTNVDLIAKALGQSAQPKDLIVVSPWYYGISFGRYYSGPAPWTPLPPVEDRTIHRYDTIKQLIAEPDQAAVIREVLDKMTEALKSGNRVWLVGDFSFLAPGETLSIQPPAPNKVGGWYSPPHIIAWSTQAACLVQSHARHMEIVNVPLKGAVNSLENLPVMMADGWREN